MHKELAKEYVNKRFRWGPTDETNGEEGNNLAALRLGAA
jgi:hypothetical protein